MNPDRVFINSLFQLKSSDRFIFRNLAQQGIGSNVKAFDIFTKIWWPLRKKFSTMSNKETCWLIAKLFCAFPIPLPHDEKERDCSLPTLLGEIETDLNEMNVNRHTSKFKSLLVSPFENIESNLRWALTIIKKRYDSNNIPGFSWDLLMSDLSSWKSPASSNHRNNLAKNYLNATTHNKRRETC